MVGAVNVFDNLVVDHFGACANRKVDHLETGSCTLEADFGDRGRIVLQMVDSEFIRQKHLLDGWSVRQISRQLHLARQTVRKALASAEIPRYHLTKPRPCPAMDVFADIIHTWLDQDKVAPPKQRHTARRIYDRLVQEYSFTGAESTVRDFVAQLRPALT